MKEILKELVDVIRISNESVDWYAIGTIIATVFLGSVAILQNKKLSNINANLQERQMYASKGMLCPVKNKAKTAQITPMEDVQIGQIVIGAENYEHPDSTLLISLQNRGTDIIYGCHIVSCIINDNPIATSSALLTIELGDVILYDFDLHHYRNKFPDSMYIEIVFLMRNSSNCTYFERFTANYKKIDILGTYRYTAYNYEITKNIT